jgi:uncharacterized protein (DUF362 family)
MNASSKVSAIRVDGYNLELIKAKLPDSLFQSIQKKHTVILKPNWVMEAHKERPDDWEYVITHPAVISAVLQKVMERLDGQGRVVILDGPETAASFAKLISRYPVGEWRQLAKKYGVHFEIIDLRDHEWITRHDIVVQRKQLPGDPRGKVLVNLRGENSEFWGHRPSSWGYYGADYNKAETNQAHNGFNNLYSVSRTVLEADVFINLPKLKTHRKAGITACLKNLVGINTYKNYLPHHNEGGPAAGGDQFPQDNFKARCEGPLLRFLKQNILANPFIASRLSSLNPLGRRLFGDTRKVIRSGNWYGNDTIWRMILDLNKVLFYANPDGTLRPENLVYAKKYIGIVDAILAGEGFGPLAPDPVKMGYLFCGTNPVALDAVSATCMGFDPMKIPTISHAFGISHYVLGDFRPEDIQVQIDGAWFPLGEIPPAEIIPFEPYVGWKGRIEKTPIQDRREASPQVKV